MTEQPDKPLRINVGSGMFPLDGFVNVDQYEPADVRGDFTKLAFENVDEVVMSHVLEHIAWPRTIEVLRHVRGWLKPGGKLTVEVPDMEVILSLGTGNPWWVSWVYGESSHPGEEHRAGFNAALLVAVLIEAGFHVETTLLRRFLSEHPARRGFPCIEAVAFNP